MKHEILIVDDEADIRNLISGILEDEGYETRLAANGYEALQEIQRRQPQLVVLDVWLGDSERDGLKILEQIKRDHPFVPVLMISGHGTIETAVTAIKNGAYDFIEKPFKTERLLVCIERAMESSRLRRENAELKEITQQRYVTVGNSIHAQRLRETIGDAAQNNSRVFIEGPFGTGKESIAKEIHERSARGSQPFVVVNCGAISPVKLEAELFGIEIDEQSPDTPRKIGLLEKAHKGTLYFEDISLLPLPTQGKIIRVLQEEAFTRLGGTQPTPVNIRFMASSSFNVSKAITEGNLREDLYYRLKVHHIFVPPLVDRLLDLPLMVEAIAQSIALTKGLAHKRFSEEVLVFLQMHHWPKNIHELQAVLETILLKANDSTTNPVLMEHLPADLLQSKRLQTLKGSPDMVVLPMKEARELFEKEYLSAQVNRFAGNITKTANFIGMERSALHRKLKALGLEDVRSDKN